MSQLCAPRAGSDSRLSLATAPTGICFAFAARNDGTRRYDYLRGRLGTLFARLVQGLDLHRSVRRANSTAAMSVPAAGAVCSYPTAVTFASLKNL